MVFSWRGKAKGEEATGGRNREYILANTFEAVLGAFYMDQGYAPTKQFIEKNLFFRLDAILKDGSWQDAKSHFQEKSQEALGITPSYRMVRETGPDHDKRFTVGVYLGKDTVAEGEGRSKQEAEQSAARAAALVKGWDK